MRRSLVGIGLGSLLAAHLLGAQAHADHGLAAPSLSAMPSGPAEVEPDHTSTTCQFDFTSNPPAVTRVYGSQVLCEPAALANIAMQVTAFTLGGDVVKASPAVNCPGPATSCSTGDSFFPAIGIYQFRTHYVLTLPPGGTWASAIGGSVCTGTGTPVLDCNADNFG